MLRRQFLTGAIAAASVAAFPATASARRMRLIVLPGGNSAAVNWFYGILGGIVGVAAIGRGVFWVKNRLTENPAPPRYVPPDQPPNEQAVPAARTATTTRRSSGPTTFGKRGF